VAEAICRLLEAPKERLRHRVYNLAYGEPKTVGDLVDLVGGILRLEIVPEEKAEIRISAKRKTGRWGAYDIARAEADLGWRPRPLATALAEYIAWIRANES